MIIITMEDSYGFCAPKECFNGHKDWLTQLVAWLERNVQDNKKGLAWNIENDRIEDTMTQEELDKLITDMEGALKYRKGQLLLLDS